MCVRVNACGVGLGLIWSEAMKQRSVKHVGGALARKIRITQFQGINVCCLFLTRLRHANLNHWFLSVVAALLFCFVLFVFYFKQKLFEMFVTRQLDQITMTEN